jgi:predicted PurR-regulated permease PerM
MLSFLTANGENTAVSAATRPFDRDLIARAAASLSDRPAPIDAGWPDMADGPPNDEQTRNDATRVALIERGALMLLVLGLLVGVLAIVKPFTTAILFGATLATAAWPLRQALVRRGLRRGAAAALLLLLSLVIVVLPMLVVAPHLVSQLGQGVQRVQSYFAATPQQPAWIKSLPLFGRRAAAAWDRFVEVKGNLRTLLEPYTADLEQAVIGVARALADSLVQVLLALIVATMFWTSGDALVAVLHDALRRLGGPIAERALVVAAGAIRGVAYGVVGTAAIQAGILTLGLAIAGVPGAAMLGFIALMLAISQIGGPLLVLIWGGAAWWLFAQDQQAWGVFMIVWGVFVSMVDNFIKPWLIGFGIEMPMSLTILGVFGGFVAFGFLGLFIGPTLIAIMFNLVQTWRAALSAPHPTEVVTDRMAVREL